MKKIITPLIVISILALLIFGGYWVIDGLFPKANPINVPSVSSVVSMAIAKNEMRKSGEPHEIASTDIDSILLQLSEAEPTRKMSVQDSPDAQIYYEIAVKTNERTHYFYVYEEDTVYIEIPYEGIYRATPEFLDFVSQHYESNKDNKTINVTENSVSEIGREEFNLPVEITEDDANKLSQIINSGVWKEEPTECESDCVINLKGSWTYYDSNSGTLNKYNFADMSIYSSADISFDSISDKGFSGKSLVLSDEDRITINAILEKYISLGITDIVKE